MTRPTPSAAAKAVREVVVVSEAQGATLFADLNQTPGAMPDVSITPACVIQAGAMVTRYCHGRLKLLSDCRKNGDLRDTGGCY